MPEEQKTTQNITPESINDIVNQMATAKKEMDLEAMAQGVKTITAMIGTGGTALQRENPDLLKRLKDSRADVQWYVLDRSDTALYPELFEEHLAGYFEQPEGLVLSQLQTRLSGVPLYEDRDAIKQQIRAAMAKSTATIGSEQIESAGATVEPTIASWLRDWKEFIGDRKVDALIMVEYFNTNKNVQQLSDEARAQLEDVLKFDHRLSFSSETKEGHEGVFFTKNTETGTYIMFDNGKETDTGVEIPEEELEALRYIEGLDSEGKPLSMADVVRREARYAQPEEVKEEAPASSKSQPQEQPEPSAAEVIKKATKEMPPEEKPQSAPKPAPKPAAAPAPKPTPAPAPPTPPAPPAPKPKAPQPKPAPQPEPNPQPVEMSNQDIAEEVLNTLKLMFPSVEAERRFLGIITEYVGGNSDKDETTKNLTAPVEDGGASLDHSTIETVLATADEVTKELKANPKTKLPTYQEQATHFVPSFDQIQDKISKEQIDRTPDKATELVEDIFSNINPIFDESTTPDTPPAPQQPEKKQPIIPEEPLENVDDDHPTVMGPLEELEHMNTTELRRLAGKDGIAAASAKLIEKFHLLEQESIAKRAEGIDAWKRSPLNQLYVNIGNTSLETATPVGKIIEQMNAEGEETLTQEEFDAIADLNKHIRF